MKNYFILAIVVFFMGGCDKKPTRPPEGSNIYWKYGFVAPLNYQADISYVNAFVGKDQELRLMTGGSAGGLYDGDAGNYFHPETASANMDQSATIDPPNAILVNWYSMQEGQYYAVLVKIDDKAKKIMTTACKQNGPESEDDYNNRILIGLAPGGYARAWLTGVCDGLPDIGHFKGWKVDKDMAFGDTRDLNSDYMQRYRERMKEVINKPVPYDNWK